VSDGSTQEDGPTHGGVNRIAEAVDAVIEAVGEYSQATGMGGQQKDMARVHLHREVVALYLRMEPYLAHDTDAWEDVSDCEYLDREYLWRGRHPRLGREITIQGLQDVREWVERTESVHRTADGPNSHNSTQSQQLTVYLPAGAAIEIAWLLRRFFREFGWDADIQHDTPLDEPEGGDLVELLGRRGQSEALEQLPDRFIRDYMENNGQHS